MDRNGVSILQVGDLPLGCAAVCRASISVQELSVEAAISGDIDLLRQAFMMDPLVGAVCNPPEIEQLVDEMLVAQAQWLPQWKAEVRRAKKRLAGAKSLGTKKTKGAARLKTKTIGEMKKDRKGSRTMAKAADKGNLLAKKKAKKS